MIIECPFCGGEGSYILVNSNEERTCTECRGKGYIDSGRVNMVREKPGISDDSGIARLRH